MPPRNTPEFMTLLLLTLPVRLIPSSFEWTVPAVTCR
jgi:hypothetical protein